jgi:ADP-ribose pyrophosphatase
MENVVIDGPEITGTEVVYDGYFKVNKHSIKNGEAEYTREVVDRGNSVAGIVHNTETDKYLFVKQWRPGAEGEMIEIVAGSLDVVGEKPEEALKREIVEEMGYKVDHMNHLRDFYTSPGGLSEIVSLFYVEVSEKIGEGGGVDNENIEVIEVDYLGATGTLFWNMDVENGGQMIPPYQLIDAKSIVAVGIVETNRILGDMADVLTQAKMRTL